MSPEETLAYIMECNIPANKHNETCEIALKYEHDIFPLHKSILVAKKKHIRL